jgi:hypothetical protein
VPRPIEFLGSGTKARGVTGYYERRLLDDTAAIAGQARVAISSTDARVSAGLIGKRWLADAGVMLLAELDLVRQSFSGAELPTTRTADPCRELRPLSTCVERKDIQGYARGINL